MNLDFSRGQNYGVKHLLSANNGPLDEYVQENLGLEASKVKELLRFGAIYVDGNRCLNNVDIKNGTYIRVHQNPRRFPKDVLKFPDCIFHECAEYLIINKPQGLPVHASVDNLHENIIALLEQKMGIPLYVTHRLDVATSGLLLIAKSKQAQTKINFLFSQNRVKKIYKAVISTALTPPMGNLIHYMEPSPRAPKKVSRIEHPKWVDCRLTINSAQAIDKQNFIHKNFILPSEVTSGSDRPFLGENGLHKISNCLETSFYELTIELLTGRTHQIRAQLAELGCPLIGDIAYGSDFRLASHEKICLQCNYLAFPRSLDYQDLDGDLCTFNLTQRPW